MNKSSNNVLSNRFRYITVQMQVVISTHPVWYTLGKDYIFSEKPKECLAFVEIARKEIDLQV